MAIYLTNAFALSMFEDNVVPIKNITTAQAVTQTLTVTDYDGYNPSIWDMAEVSAIGHESTAKMVEGILNEVWDHGLKVSIPTQRIKVSAKAGDTIIVAQYSGPRLPEGATQLPEGATIEFYHIVFMEKSEVFAGLRLRYEELRKHTGVSGADLGYAGCQTE